MNEVQGANGRSRPSSRQGISIPNKTAKGEPSFAKGGGENGWMTTNEHWLPRLIADRQQVPPRRRVKFLEGHILEHVVDGRIYAEIHPFKSEDGGTKSLRFSVSRSAAAADAEERSRNRAADPQACFLAEEDEVCGLRPTLRQQEFRKLVALGVVHNLPGAREAAEEYRNNPDADFHQHGRRADRAAAQARQERQLRKYLWFRRRAGWPTMIGYDVAEARCHHGVSTTKSCHSSRSWIAWCSAMPRRNGYTELYGGARRHWNLYEVPFLEGQGTVARAGSKRRARASMILSIRGTAGKLRAHGIYKSLNALVQGSAAIHTKLWMLAVWRDGIMPMLQMHDELECSVKTREQGEMIARLGCEAVQLAVPIKVDLGSVGPGATPATNGKTCRPRLRRRQTSTAASAFAVARHPDRLRRRDRGGRRSVIELPLEHIAITELAPFDENVLISKSIDQHNHIMPYPKVKWWTQTVAKIPATMVALEDYLPEARSKTSV